MFNKTRPDDLLVRVLQSALAQAPGLDPALITDAIGGVINFILRTDYRGLEASVNNNYTEEGGGATRRVSLLGGVGSLQEQGFNLMGSVTYDNNDKLSSSQRSFANGFRSGPAPGVPRGALPTRALTGAPAAAQKAPARDQSIHCEVSIAGTYQAVSLLKGP